MSPLCIVFVLESVYMYMYMNKELYGNILRDFEDLKALWKQTPWAFVFAVPSLTT